MTGKEPIRIALPKGRLGEQVYSLLEKAGFACPGLTGESRKLVFENPEAGVRYFWVKPSDAAVYVRRGAADMGVAGYDVLRESRQEVYELMDLGLGRCRMAVAAPKGFTDAGTRPLRVATKYPRIATKYYGDLGRDIDLIELHGSIELAPLLGLSDVIVDIVETGTTLRENGLEVVAEVLPVSARLIANRACYSFRSGEIDRLCRKIRAVLEKERMR